MKTRVLVCVGTSGISAGAEDVANNFEKEIKKNKIQNKFEVIRAGDRGLFRDVLVDIIPQNGERVTYEFVKPMDVKKIVKNHLVNGEVVKELCAGEDYKRFFEKQMRIVLCNCGEIDPENIDEYTQKDGYSALKKALKMNLEQH